MKSSREKLLYQRNWRKQHPNYLRNWAKKHRSGSMRLTPYGRTTVIILGVKVDVRRFTLTKKPANKKGLPA